jgi:hypothetical protein
MSTGSNQLYMISLQVFVYVCFLMCCVHFYRFSSIGTDVNYTYSVSWYVLLILDACWIHIYPDVFIYLSDVFMSLVCPISVPAALRQPQTQNTPMECWGMYLVCYVALCFCFGVWSPIAGVVCDICDV